jgi:hypothetical protein
MSGERLHPPLEVVARWDGLGILGLSAVLYAISMWPSVGSTMVVAAPYLAIPLGFGWVCAFTWRCQCGRPPTLTFRSGSRHASEQSGDERRAFGRDSPMWLQAVGLLAMVSLFLGLAVSPGTPVEDGGRYLLHNHSDVTQISSEAFLMARSWKTRQLLSGIVLAATGLLMFLDNGRSVDR